MAFTSGLATRATRTGMRGVDRETASLPGVRHQCGDAMELPEVAGYGSTRTAGAAAGGLEADRRMRNGSGC